MDKDNTNGKDTTGNVFGKNKGKVKRMAVSMKQSPVLTGEAAKKIIRQLDNPPDNSHIFKKLESMPKIIKRK